MLCEVTVDAASLAVCEEKQVAAGKEILIGNKEILTLMVETLVAEALETEALVAEALVAEALMILKEPLQCFEVSGCLGECHWKQQKDFLKACGWEMQFDLDFNVCGK